MTRAEFDAWIEKRYIDLLKVARRKNYRDAAHLEERAAGGGWRDRRGPEDTLQAAVAGMLDSSKLADTPLELAWPWAVSFLRGTARSTHRATARKRALAAGLKRDSRAGSIHGRRRPAARAE